ncbi:hypothetical protein [Emticicia agri]|uniref:Uncharacterized protein n=1 Tax=Emticicia agri TaxID=2492393 RepID=A0A4Q5LXT0_9BACT|nr:hypothetical protein [Emticicia agri]RYU94449.1 hypothetical protein EWM59_16755 [Emticicia agri]
MTIDQKNKVSGLAFLLTALPTMVFANAGSPMMWFGVFHLLILNAVIGWKESAIISKFKIPNRTWLIIIGNYVSMFIGLDYIAPHFSTLIGNHDFWGGKTRYGDYKLQGFTLGMVTSFIATLIIELPFFYLAVKDKFQRRQIFIPFLVANTLTNIIMTIIYFWIVKGGAHW